MTDVNSIQTAYQDLYVQLRRYIWDFDVVCMIADVEVESFKMMPSIPAVKGRLDLLKSRIFDIIREDEDLKKAVDKFYEVLNSGTECFARLQKVTEVNQL